MPWKGVEPWRDRIGRILVAALALWSTSAGAEVTRIEITSREPMQQRQAVGAAGPYEIIRGRIHGEVDPKDPHNAIIQDLDLAPRNARGKVEYVATFALAKPVDHGEGVARAHLSGRQPRQRPGRRRAPRGTSRSSAAGRAT